MKHLILSVLVLALGVRLVVAEEHNEEKDIVVLENNVRLDFRLVPLEDDDKGVFIVTAASWYELETRLEGDGDEIEFTVAGGIEPADKGKYFVTYNVNVEFSGEESHARFEVGASVLISPGQNVELARMGKTLVVELSLADKK